MPNNKARLPPMINQRKALRTAVGRGAAICKKTGNGITSIA
jgi:hypothetical protein